LGQTLKGLRNLGNPRFIGLIDQGLLAAFRFASLILFARVLSKDAFGVISLVAFTTYFLVSVQRALVAIPFIRACATRDELLSKGSNFFWLSVTLACFCGLAFMVASSAFWLISAPSWLIQTTAVLVIAGPSVWFYEFTRRWLYQWMTFRSILFQVIALSTLAVACLTFLMISSYPWEAAIATVIIPYLVPALIMTTLGFRPKQVTLRSVASTLRGNWPISRWLLADCSVNAIQTIGMQFWIAASSGPGGAAAYAAARNLVAPVMTLISSIDISEMPRLSSIYATKGQHGFNQHVTRVGIFIACLVIPFLIGMSSFSAAVLDVVYGKQYAGHTTELHLWIIAASLLAIAAPLEMWLLISKSSKSVFGCRLLGGLTTASVGVFLIPQYGASGGIAASILGVSALCVAEVVSIWIARRQAASVADK
jgi:O-antigen/teichoic acid export membrane protein